MSNQLAKRPNIDPEFQAVYDAEVHEKNCSCAVCQPEEELTRGRVKKLKASDTSDNVQALAEMAKDNEQYCRRKDFKDGSFDQIEHDVSNAGRLIFNFLVR